MECSEANVKKVKKCLMGKINKEESILECATVKLSICSPETGKIFHSLENEGILCVIVDRNKSCLYLKQYDLIEFKVVFSIELYTNISDGYTVYDNHFHTIEFPGFFLGLSFPILENPNVANRSSFIQKAIISTSKFISVKLSEYVYLNEFDHNKILGKKYKYIKTGSERSLSVSKSKNLKMNMSDKTSNESKEHISNNNIDNENNNNNKLNENNIEQDSSKKLNNIKEKENNKIENNEENNENNIKNNEENNNNNIQDENKINNNNLKEGITPQKPETEEEKERNLFDSIIIEDAPNKKIYKIVQYHLIREKMRVIKKIYKKNFNRFIDANKISYDNIKDYKINTYDFLNDILSSSDEGEKEKTFVDYLPSKDMIGDLEDEHIDDEDERLKELMQKKNNLKEIMKKNVNEKGIFKTTTAENNY